MYIFILALFFGWFSSVKANSQIVIELEDTIKSREPFIEMLTVLVEDLHETDPQEIIEIFMQRFISLHEEGHSIVSTMYNALLNDKTLTLEQNINNTEFSQEIILSRKDIFMQHT